MRYHGNRFTAVDHLAFLLTHLSVSAVDIVSHASAGTVMDTGSSNIHSAANRTTISTAHMNKSTNAAAVWYSVNRFQWTTECVSLDSNIGTSKPHSTSNGASNSNLSPIENSALNEWHCHTDKIHDQPTGPCDLSWIVIFLMIQVNYISVHHIIL